MSPKEEALQNVIKDLKKKLDGFVTDLEYYGRKVKEHEIMVKSHQDLITHLESTSGWSCDALSMDNGGIGGFREVTVELTPVPRKWWQRLLGLS